MTFKGSFLKKMILFTLALQLAGLTPLLSLPKAQALFWEDEFEGNDPKDIKKRPKSFFLFDMIDDLNKDAKKNAYKERDDRDKGASVNNDARTLLILSAGIVGLGTGLLIANRLAEGSSDQSGSMFVGGALGLVAGVGIGALLMPRSYEVDTHANVEFLKDRQARLEDPLQMIIAKSFHQPQAAFHLQF